MNYSNNLTMSNSIFYNAKVENDGGKLLTLYKFLGIIYSSVWNNLTIWDCNFSDFAAYDGGK